MNLLVPVEAMHSNRFLREYLPNYLLTKTYAGMDARKTLRMNEHLRSIGVDDGVCQIVKKAYLNLDCESNGEFGVVRISPILKENGRTLSQLCRLIDKGNLEVKGLGCISRAFECAQLSMDRLIENYLREI